MTWLDGVDNEAVIPSTWQTVQLLRCRKIDETAFALALSKRGDEHARRLYSPDFSQVIRPGQTDFHYTMRKMTKKNGD